MVLQGDPGILDEPSSPPEYAFHETAAAFADINQELAAHPDPATVLQKLTQLAVERVPGTEWAGITRLAGGELVTIGATDPAVEQVDQIQYALAAGPCVDAVLEGNFYNAPDLRLDARWPEFGRRAHEATGVVSMLSHRLFVEDIDDQINGLNIYSTQPDAFDGLSRTIAFLLATHGAFAISAAHAKHKNRNLEIALANARQIGIAIGILMYSMRVTHQEAFLLLRMSSQHSHRKLAEIAAEVAETGILPALPERHRAARPT